MTISPDELKRFFAGECEFKAGAMDRSQIPGATLPEVAFAGRSNVGKSSLVNSLTGRKTLARVSQTPGRTRQINFFSLRDQVMLVDLPGYGYAKVSGAERELWDQLIVDYLTGRPTLRRVFLLIDGRHGLKDLDIQIMKLMDTAAVSYQIVLTKADKASGKELESAKEVIMGRMKKHPALYPEILITSSRESQGVNELRNAVAEFVRK